MLDFLYSDHERVAALMAQIEGVGAQVGFGRTYQKAKQSGKSLDIDIPFVSGGFSSGNNLNKELRQEYDPLWANSKKLVEIIDEKSADQSLDFQYGDLVSVGGRLLCLDQGFINEIMKSEAIISKIAEGIDIENTQRSPKGLRQEKSEMAKLIRDFVQSLPLGMVFILLTDSDAFWFNVKREYLQIQDLDIPLKFPVSIGGEWRVTGIVDALPQDHASGLSIVPGLGEKLIFPQALTLITQFIIPLITLFGRPADAYGLSPITIHREIRF